MTPEQRTLVGRHIRQERTRQGISVSQAARSADIGRSTWIAVEAGTRDTEEHTLGRVERVLGWAHGTIGSIADVITPNGSVADTAPADDDWVARLIAIRDSPRRSPALRTMAAAQLTQLEALLAAADAEDAQRVSGDRAG
ncbi:transcriptional regulator with XRE-family HTH domain [Catenuloplanes nepalensis]|uniref:Transcriptional regulator with XRE-family HTH domain n=1 Tax=Catenuloplanes nepalensis TaxID=587533 RepID=A0ABT9MVZ7_9ACTN|nr:helix-turn-helix transcriptional regulator [Catenuloplanes nepalensis]MDP9795559.1 transcriptional regulator with XRE-family HTH domain [Catenuloplanes nepalensis]